MFAAMLMPRPNAEYAMSELPLQIGSPDQTSSPYGVGRDGVKENQPWAKAEEKEEQGGKERREEWKTIARFGAGADGKSDGKKPAGDKKGEFRPGKSSAKDEPGKAQSQAKDRTSRCETIAARRKRRAIGKIQRSQEDANQPRCRERPEVVGRVEPAEKQPKDNKPQERSGDGRTSEKPQQPRRVPAACDAAARRFAAPGVVQMFFYLAVAIVAVYWLWKNRAALWAGIVNFWPWLLGLWHGFFGGRVRAGPSPSEADLAKVLLPQFVDFTDPFAAGTAGKYPPEKLVRYTFEALEAWARDHGFPRQPEQTPHEFARSIGSQVKSVANDTALLANVYCQVAYAPGTLSAGALARLPHLWRNMRAESFPVTTQGFAMNVEPSAVVRPNNVP